MMSETKYLKCPCASCGGHIEFPADAIGSTVPCPHCGWQTELTLETPTVQSARSSGLSKWIIAGVLILFLGVMGIISVLLVAPKLLKKVRAGSPSARSVSRPARTNTLTVASPAAPANRTNDFSFSKVIVEKTPGNTLIYAKGTLKNETDKQRFGVTVEIELLDPSRAKIGTAKDYVDLIEPRAEWKVRASVLQKNAASARVANVKEQQ